MMLLHLLEHKFGELPDWVGVKVNAGSIDDLRTWASQILTAGTLADVFR